MRLTVDTLEAVGEMGADLVGTLDGLEGTLLLVHQQTGAGGEPMVQGAPAEELLALARRAKQLRADLRFLLRAADAEYVYFLEVRGRGCSCGRRPSTCHRWCASPCSIGGAPPC